MSWFRGWQRFKQSRGHGVHSPFAFDLIRKVLRSTHHYYAFDEIEDHTAAHHYDLLRNSSFYHLSFRLVNYLKAKRILEIHSGAGVNTLFLISSDRNIRCSCVEDRADQVAIAKRLTAAKSSQCTMLSHLPEEGIYDAIVLYPEEGVIPSTDTLLRLSHDDTVWIIHPVNRGKGKQFWHNIVNDERIGITFDMKDTGIAFCRQSFSRLHYYL